MMKCAHDWRKSSKSRKTNDLIMTENYTMSSKKNKAES